MAVLNGRGRSSLTDKQTNNNLSVTNSIHLSTIDEASLATAMLFDDLRLD
jgi:hypothetical protein